MQLETMMTLEAALMIALVVAAAGTVTTQLFRHTSSPYLIAVTGTRGQLIVAGALIWVAAIAIGVLALIIVSAATSSLVGLALFFGIEAVALDICAHRTRYVRVQQSERREVHVHAHHRY